MPAIGDDPGCFHNREIFRATNVVDFGPARTGQNNFFAGLDRAPARSWFNVVPKCNRRL